MTNPDFQALPRLCCTLKLFLSGHVANADRYKDVSDYTHFILPIYSVYIVLHIQFKLFFHIFYSMH